MSAVARFDTLNDAESPPLPGLSPIRGRQRQALLASFPSGTRHRDGVAREYFGPPSALASIYLPAAGCGQLIGADSRGRGVAIALTGARTRHIEIEGNLHLVQQVILRAIALGARVSVQTSRPDAWRPMITAVDSPRMLSLAARSAGSHQAGAHQATVVVYDGVEGASPTSDATIIRVVATSSSRYGDDPDLTLAQSHSAASLVSVHTGATVVETTMIATPEEMKYIGASLDVHDRRVASLR